LTEINRHILGSAAAIAGPAGRLGRGLCYHPRSRRALDPRRRLSPIKPIVIIT